MSAPTTTAPDLKTLAVAGKGTIFSIQNGATSATGTVTTSGTSVTWVSGTVFPTGTEWAGATITINSVEYEIEGVTDNHDLVLTASAGSQTAVTYSVTAPQYTQVAELKTCDFTGSKNDIEDVTSFDSEGRFKQYIVTLADAGDCNISGNYITSDTGQSAFRGAFNSGASLSWQITLPLQAGQTTQGETWTFSGLVQELDNNLQYDKAITFSAKVKVTGPISVVAGQ